MDEHPAKQYREAAEQYREAIEAVKSRYEERIVALLGRVAEAMKDRGYTPSEIVLDDGGEEYGWVFVAHDANMSLERAQAKEELIDVSFTISESSVAGDGFRGVNFELRAHAARGCYLCGVTPFNYTRRVWVRLGDPAALEERLALVEETDAWEFVCAAADAFETGGAP